jgi:hypothetical protein
LFFGCFDPKPLPSRDIGPAPSQKICRLAIEHLMSIVPNDRDARVGSAFVTK